MVQDSSRDVVRNPNSGWDVRAPGASRASTHHHTQAEAIDRGREIVGDAGGGELRIHDQHDRIRDAGIIPLGDDPNPPDRQ